MKKLFLLVMMLGAMYAVTGCNTVEGVGKDVEAVGDGVKDAAN